MRISGQVIRTHPVHPELVSGTFKCMDCQTVIKDVEQQFKYMQVTLISLVKFFSLINHFDLANCLSKSSMWKQEQIHAGYWSFKIC